MSLKTLTKTIAATGAVEALTATRTRCGWFVIQVAAGNSGTVSVVDSGGTIGHVLGVPVASQPEEKLEVAPGHGQDVFDLSLVYVKGTINDVVYVVYSPY